MRICIDARWISPELSGIGLYTQELIRALAQVDRANEYVLLFGDESVMRRTVEAANLKPDSGFRFQVSGFGLFSPTNQLLLPRLLRREKVDLYHSTNYMMPLLGMGGIKRVVTIHDLIPLMFRDHAPQARKAKFFPIYKELMHQVARRADLILTVSESTKRDIVRQLRATPEKVIVTPEGVGTEFKPQTQNPKSQILYVGRRDPYKNLPLLIEAFGDVLKKVPQARLRVIGPDDPRYPEAPSLAKKLGIENRIDWIGYVSPDQLIREYQDAAVYVLPSKYEGFGLTVLEAMACGTPVVCSNASSLPEVAGDAALLVTPSDRAALADALTLVLSDPSASSSLRQRGLQQAARFTWRRTAELTLRAYQAALASTSP